MSMSMERTDSARTGREKRAGGGLPPAGNQATGTLKLIALLFMLIDHLGAVVFPHSQEMRILGRIAFPVYCWCMVVGFHYTRSVSKYLGRILLTGIISQPLYAYVMNHVGNTGNLLYDWMLAKPNIFLTLLLGLAALWGIREERFGSRIWAPVLAILLATVLKVDYGWRGVLFIILLYAARGTRSSVAALMVAYFLYWGTLYRVTSSFFGMPFDVRNLPAYLSEPLGAFLRMETYGLMALPLILIPFRRNIRLPAWVSYGIYPAHLLIVLLVKTLV